MPRREPIPFMEALGQRIRNLRETRCWTLEETAAKLGMSKTGLWQIEKAMQLCSAAAILRLSLVFGVSADWLLKGE